MKPSAKTLTIIEGVDGSGKSTYAAQLASEHDALLVHHGPMPGANGDTVPRLFLESMLPALLGYADVILDRCWLSEPIYGEAFRGGADRVGWVRARMLERCAMRCSCVVVRCQPPWSECLRSFRGRKGVEYLETEDQLRMVYTCYSGLQTSLPVVDHDWTHGGLLKKLEPTKELKPHPLGSRSAGNLEAPVVLVGDTFGAVKNQDLLYQLPFVSFNQAGCSHWLTAQLEDVATEAQLLWVNSDDPCLEQVLEAHPRTLVIALGATAHSRLEVRGVADTPVNHPQHAKRFHHKQEYALLPLLREVLS